jgi:predicted ABC-type ATPase
MVWAGRAALIQQKQHLAGRSSFALETTFSGNRELALMQEAKKTGYKVNLIFICTESPLLSVGRVALRVRDGGHFVPEVDIIRRYRRSIANLPKGLKLADRAWLLDNSQKRTRLIASFERDRVKSASQALPRWVRSANISALEQNCGLSL